MHVRTWIIALGLCLFCFFIPLQFFVIGENTGFGMQGAVYRWQMTFDGSSLIPIMREVLYLTDGVYTGKSAFMVIFWGAGTFVLSLTTMVALMYWNQLPRNYLRFIILGIITASSLYIASCIAQYGFQFHGPAGISVPFGVILLLIFSAIIFYYQNFLYSEGWTELKSPDNS